jgi:hypothetical protein
MKIVFRNLPEGEGTVKVSLDGGNTFIDHQINTVRENGIPLADNQDYSKILIKGSANILRNLDILSRVKIDGGAAQSSSNIEWYAWSLPDNEGVIYTKTINPTDQCIAYQKMGSNFLTIEYPNEPGSHYFEFSEEGTLFERVYNYKPGHTNIWERCPSEDIEAIVGIPYTYEKPVYGLGTVTYKCYVLDQDNNGERDNSDSFCVYAKNVNNKDTFYFYIPANNANKPFAEHSSELINALEYSDGDFHIIGIDKQSDNSLVVSGSDGSPGRFIPYPTNDITVEEQTVIGTETVTEVIKFIQDPPTVTENGTVIADEGKAFKLANVEVPKSELGFKCFYNYAPSHHFGNVPEATQALDSGTRNYNILMSNEYLRNLYKMVFSSSTYNGVVGIANKLSREVSVDLYYTLDDGYNLFNYYTTKSDDTIILYFYDSINSPKDFRTVEVILNSGLPLINGNSITDK